jgi:Flp pilus assembly protein TadB
VSATADIGVLVAVTGAFAAAAWGFVAFEETNAALRARALEGRSARMALKVRRSLVDAARAAVTERSPLALRLAVVALCGLLALVLGGNVVVVLAAAAVGATGLQTLARARAAARQRRLVERMPAFLSGVLMAYLTEGSLPRAVVKTAPETPDPLGGLIRGAVAAARANEGGARRTVGELLWDVATSQRVRALQRLAHTLRQAEKGAATDAVYAALEDIEKELREDERLRRGRVLASRQSTIIVQAGAVGAGVLYVALGLAGYASVMRSGFGVLVTAVAALLVGVSVLIAYAAARRAVPGTTAQTRGAAAGTRGDGM